MIYSFIFLHVTKKILTGFIEKNFIFFNFNFFKKIIFSLMTSLNTKVQLHNYTFNFFKNKLYSGLFCARTFNVDKICSLKKNQN